MNGIILIELDRSLFVHDLASDVEHAAHDAFTDRHGDRRASVRDIVAAFQTFGAGHGDGADPIVAEVLLDFERELHGLVLDFVIHGQSVVDTREVSRELDVHYRTDDLNDFAFIHVFKFSLVTAGVGVSPHFFRQHTPEKSED